jgi:hypothetical protein
MMENLAKAWPEKILNYGGQAVKVRCNFGSIRDIQLATGVNPLRDLSRLAAPDIAVAFLWSNLRKIDPKISLQDVADNIRPDEVGPVFDLIAEALKALTPEPKAAKPGE